MEITDDSTVKQVKEHFNNTWREGTVCPCCKQTVKLYKRNMNAGMACGLIYIYKIHNELNKEKTTEWIKVADELIARKLNPANLEYSKLAYWKLIEPKPNTDDPTKRDSGYWKITELGRKFVRGEVTVPAHALVYNGNVRKMAEIHIDIHQALGDKFNYNDLMGESPDGGKFDNDKNSN